MFFTKDINGWSIVDVNASANILYISPTGDDATAQVYTKSDFPNFLNPGPVNAFATYAAAFANTVENNGDAILFETGGVYYDRISGLRNGKSITEPFVVSFYGDTSLPVPQLKTSLDTCFKSVNRGFSNIFISGIKAYSNEKDPDSVEFTATDSDYGFYIYVPASSAVSNLYLEGCNFRFYNTNFTITPAEKGDVSGVELYRTVITDAYSDAVTPQGFGIVRSAFTLDQCIFDHNGWYSQAGSGGVGEATIYSHNSYCGDCDNTTVKDSILSRGSSMGLKFTHNIGIDSISITNNLLLDNEIGLALGGNYPENNYGVTNTLVDGNICMYAGLSRPTSRTLAWGYLFQSWDVGVLSNNISIQQNDATLSGFSYQIACEDVSSGTGQLEDTPFRDVVVSQNISHGCLNTTGMVLTRSSLLDTCTFSGNLLDSGVSEVMSFDEPIPATNIFNASTYSAEGSAPFITDLGFVSFYKFAELTGDVSVQRPIKFLDPARSIETYMEYIGEAPYTLDNFHAKTRAQDRFNWDERFTAIAVNAYIKEGFTVVPAEFKAPNKFNGSNNKYKYPVQQELIDADLINGEYMYLAGVPVAKSEGDLTADGIMNFNQQMYGCFGPANKSGIFEYSAQLTGPQDDEARAYAPCLSKTNSLDFSVADNSQYTTLI